MEREGICKEGKEKERCLEEKRERLRNKQLHSVFLKNTEFRDKTSWNWLSKGDLKKTTEGTIIAAQEQSLRTRSIQYRIDKSETSPMCRLCNQREETVAHILSECQVLAQNQYKNWRHDKVAQIIHWYLCKLHDLDHNEKWYEHKPEVVQENNSVKLLWDMRIQTDKVLEYTRPDIVLLDKINASCLIIDVACPFDTRVPDKEVEKITKYQDLKWEIQRIWKCRAKVIPIIIGCLGTISKNHLKWLKEISDTIIFDIIQKACLLGSARVLRYCLGI